MPQWEYRILEYSVPSQDLQLWLNQHGAEGWELTGLVPSAVLLDRSQSMREALTSTPSSLQWVFKRACG